MSHATTLGMLASFLLGCGEAQPPLPIEVVLGGTAADGSGFHELLGDVTLVPGSQSGFHVWVKYRISGMSAERVRVQHTARRLSDGRLLSIGDRAVDLASPGPDGFWETPLAT